MLFCVFICSEIWFSMITDTLWLASWQWTIGPWNFMLYEEFANGGDIGRISPSAAVALESRSTIVRGPRNSWLALALSTPSGGTEYAKKSARVGSAITSRGTGAVVRAVAFVGLTKSVAGVKTDGIGRHLGRSERSVLILQAWMAYTMPSVLLMIPLWSYESFPSWKWTTGKSEQKMLSWEFRWRLLFSSKSSIAIVYMQSSLKWQG